MNRHLRFGILVSMALLSCSTPKTAEKEPNADIRWQVLYQDVSAKPQKPAPAPALSSDAESKAFGHATVPLADMQTRNLKQPENRTERANATHAKAVQLPDADDQYIGTAYNEAEKADANQDALNPSEDNSNRNGDVWLYTTAGLMALASAGLLRKNKKMQTKLTRWAKANPRKTQALIAGIELPLLGMGLLGGYNLHEMGYDLSDVPSYVFAGAMGIGALTIPMRPKRSEIALPKVVNRRKLSYMGLSVAAVMMMAGTGNYAAKQAPDHMLSGALEQVDNAVFGAELAASSVPVKQMADADQKLNRRKLLGAGSCALAVFLITLLAILVCGGVCLTIFGIAFLVESDLIGLGFLGIILGPLITWQSIKGIKKLSQWCR